MAEVRKILVQTKEGGRETLKVVLREEPPYALIVSGCGLKNREFSGSDLFEALILLRTEVEGVGGRILCAGARRDVFPSGMARSMGSARKAYVMRMGSPATELVDIFDDAEERFVGTISEQEDYHNRWFHSLTATGRDE